MSKRKSGKELRKEYQDLLDKTKAMQKRIVKRAEELIKEYPDVQYEKVRFKNNEPMTVGDYQRYYIITPKIGLRIIELVEAYIASLHPHQQQKLFKETE
jgi:hypothetical protein